jgi:1-acyl-sn-glycerol-3-phosphate acyltransferase
MTTINLIRKHIFMAALIFGYVVSTPVLSLGPGGARRMMRNGSRFCRWTVKLLGIKIKIRGEPAHAMIVSNHLSYIDIMTILSIHPTRFISFTELGNIPGVGLIAKLSQTLLVHRSRPTLVKRDIETLESELRDGVPFVFFPEGSSFDGSRLHPFKSSLFESAIRTSTLIQPLCLRYLSLDGEPVTLKNRDRIFYHGDMLLIPQLLGLLRMNSLVVEAVFGKIIQPQGYTRKELAAAAHAEVSKEFLAVQE